MSVASLHVLKTTAHGGHGNNYIADHCPQAPPVRMHLKRDPSAANEYQIILFTDIRYPIWNPAGDVVKPCVYGVSWLDPSHL